MNHSIYIFGDLGSGYTQYPDDYAKQICLKGIDEIAANSQIALHHEGNLIYYSYYRKLLGGESPKGYIGFSICFNCVYYVNIRTLFEIFERTITDLAVSGRIIEFSKDGDVLSKTGSRYFLSEEVDRIRVYLTNEIKRLPATDFKDLPPFNYNTGNKQCININEDSDLSELIQTSNDIIFLKDTDYKSSSFIGFAKQLSNLYSDNQDICKQNETLKEQVKSLNKQNKQYKLVTFLAIFVALAIIGLIVFGYDILKLQEEVEDKRNIIATLGQAVSKKDSTIVSLQHDIAKKETQIEQQNAFLGVFSSLVPIPIAVSNIEIKNGDGKYGEIIYSKNTTFIYSRMSVYSLIDGAADIYVKFYTPTGLSINNKSSPGYSYTLSGTLRRNAVTTYESTGWGNFMTGFWKKGYYRIEFWYKDVCIGKKGFTIY